MIMRTPLALAILLAAGCASDPEFGRVNQHNIAAHVVDLEPSYAGQPMEGSSGRRSVQAVNRYLRGAVKEGAGAAAGGGGAGSAPAAPAPQ